MLWFPPKMLRLTYLEGIHNMWARVAQNEEIFEKCGYEKMFFEKLIFF